jgi:glycerol-3-phosphate dehydrogenase
MFPGAERTDFDEIARELSASSKLGADTVERLLSLYGSRALTVANYVRENPALAERFDPASSAIAAELYLAVEEEFALTLTDIFARRVLLAFEPGHGLGGLERAAEIVAPLLAWKAKDKKASIAEYRKWLDHLRVPANAGN